jgi:hypothetical protein
MKRRSIWVWLEDTGKRVGVPVLTISILSLGVGIASLSFVIANYRLQTSAIRPELAVGASEIRPQDCLVVDWANIGKKPVRRGKATLFTRNEDGSGRVQLGEADVGAGASILPRLSQPGGVPSRQTEAPERVSPLRHLLR